MRSSLVVLLSILSIPFLAGQSVPFNKGVNLSGWFQADAAREIHARKYTFKDFEDIKSLGCDVIRLPITLHDMSNGAPDYTLDPLFLEFLDTAVSWATRADLHLIIDNHTFDPAANTDPAIDIPLKKVWQQMAHHYKNAYPKLYYEVLNEPHGIDNQRWGQIQGEVIDVIRKEDTTHHIIVGPADWNSYHSLNQLPFYEDSKLIYTFHFYDPFLFTHQGASWTSPSMTSLAQVPFPYRSGAVPDVPPALKGTWIEGALNDYQNTGTETEVRRLLDIAVRFQQERKAPLFCGEFGVYIPNADVQERVNWYRLVREYLEANNIAWTSWDFHGGFGLFLPDGNDLFQHDLNIPLLDALGFFIPEQTPLIIEPEEQGFVIYDDFVGPNTTLISYATQGLLDIYNKNQTYDGQYAILWSDAIQYNSLRFLFTPFRDLSSLASQNYLLDCWIRTDAPDTKIDIRFLDTKTGPQDRPWRMRYTFDNSLHNGNTGWQHLQIPLSDFTEQGAWDEEQWFNPKGLFDWATVDQLEFVAEYGPLAERSIWLDNIQIRAADTVTGQQEISDLQGIKVFPNPASDQLIIQSPKSDFLRYRIYSLSGKKIQQAPINSSQTYIDIQHWPEGIYLVQLLDAGGNVFPLSFVKTK